LKEKERRERKIKKVTKRREKVEINYFICIFLKTKQDMMASSGMPTLSNHLIE